jgi:excisionase family DNA binding protein
MVVTTNGVLLKVDDAAQLLGLSKSKVYELLADGRLERVRIDSSTRIPMAAIDAFVESLRSEQAAAGR